jgi:predicted nucleic acid-binding protein
VKFCFFDSSALVKRYVQETGTQRVQELAASEVIFVSRVTWVEVLSAFARLSRERKADPARLFATRQLFQHDWRNQYQIVELHEEIAERAGQLVQQHVLRAYDSIQLASAFSLHPLFEQIDPLLFTFVCADDRLLSVAEAEGMRAENPNRHL